MNLRVVLACAALLSTGAAFGQYKVVGPDGSITYTDRPPADTKARVTPLSSRGGVTPALAGALQTLPQDLRQIATRFPVTLYTAGNCDPCGPARALLQQRGVPYAEKTVTSNDDLAELTRIVGSNSVPSITIGGQVIAGLNADGWNGYLDAAGYPRESKLPASYQNPLPAPLIDRTATAVTPQRQAVPAATPTPPEAPASGIRF